MDLSNENGWVTMRAEFFGGFENYLIVGNFSPSEKTKVRTDASTIISSDYAYYYMDDFTMEEMPQLNYQNEKIYVLRVTPMSLEDINWMH